VAGSLKDNRRALVVGSRSFGKGSVQELIKLDQNSGELKLTVAYYYLPSGRLVHRKKGATDWGVLPQINVPVDPTIDQKILRERYETESFRRPGTSPTTMPATMPYGSDVQLQRAVDSMMALIVLQKDGATTLPATMPSQDTALRAKPADKNGNGDVEIVPPEE
jgi:carboxyl-terminal processing protease